MRTLGKKNRNSFIILILIALIFICLFIFFINLFKNFDNEEYKITSGSVLYTDNLDFIKTKKAATLDQKIDGKYYINEDNKKTRIGTHAVVYNSNDYNINLYGKAYQVFENGDVVIKKGKIIISKSSPSKFYKLADRRYLFVDGTIKSTDGTIKTRGYLIINIDKKGNATLANNELNVKIVKNLTLKGSVYEFDIAKEILKYKDQKINLKNIIGSTNDYKEEVSSEKTGNTYITNNINNITNNNNNNNNTVLESSGRSEYYDNYLSNVINGINNLTNNINNNNIKTAESISQNGIYYDFTRWIALTGVTSTVNSITVNYSVFDPNSEYASVFITLSNANGVVSKIYLNKKDSNYTFRNLSVDTKYKVTLGYSLETNASLVTSDVAIIKTKAPNNLIKVTKIANNKIYYQVNMDINYVYQSGTLKLICDNELENTVTVNFNGTTTYNGSVAYENLGRINELRLENIVYNGSVINKSISNKFVNE